MEVAGGNHYHLLVKFSILLVSFYSSFEPKLCCIQNLYPYPASPLIVGKERKGAQKTPVYTTGRLVCVQSSPVTLHDCIDGGESRVMSTTHTVR